jgi:hypothetical protein
MTTTKPIMKETTNYRAVLHSGFPVKCFDCDIVNPAMLHIHHKNGDHSDNGKRNLEILCPTHHHLRHMKKSKVRGWVYDSKTLTPRNKLAEVRTWMYRVPGK